VPGVSDADGRTRHYGAFYGVEEPALDAPLALVIGNCQAESLRIVLDGAGVATLRVPPVHELVAGDLPHLERWLGRARFLVSQPVRDDYRGLPVGTSQLARLLPGGASVLRVPVVRFAGLYPAHAIVRPPGNRSLQPPVVEYHDLRLLAEAAARRAGAGFTPSPLRRDAVLGIAAASIADLRAREVAHDTVVVSDVFARPSFAQMRTLNHPGNAVWAHVAARVRTALALPEHDGDPGRPLLNAIHAPREAAVVEAFGLADEPTTAWSVDGEAVGADRVRAAHLRFYERHPDVVDAGLARHARAVGILGLA
jgi:Polysaccharide biosynthesis enzyme WcbI